jgi:hypothetical protein
LDCKNTILFFKLNTFAAMRQRLILMLIAVMSCSLYATSQSLKKKYAGTYVGVLSGYTMYVGEQTVDVAPCKVTVIWQSNAPFIQTLGSTFEQKGTWKITSATKTTLYVEVQFTEQQVVERFEFNRKNRTLTRIGLFPQSNAVLTKRDA